jgi:proteic killer suppression protein
MDITFASSKLEKIFNAERLLKKEYGENGRVIMRRMILLRAAKNLAEIPSVKPERCHPLKGNRKGQYAVDLKHPYRLVFNIQNNPIPLLDDDGVDLAKVDAIKILSVEDYH